VHRIFDRHGACIMPIFIFVLMKYLFIVLAFFALSAKAQKTIVTPGESKIDSFTMDTLNDMQIRMMGLGQRMILSFDEEERLTSGYHFIKHMNYALRVQGSYHFKFDSLKSVSIIYSPDDLFRIITWNLVLNNERFHYYGIIQYNPDKSKKFKDTSNLKPFYPLIDRSEQMRNALDTTVDNNFWWGATYYKIIPVKYKKETYYTLIGWNGATKMSNKKVVESLYFDHNKPYFGAPIFDLHMKKMLKRMVFEFSLRYEEKKGYLIYESVVPSRPQDMGHPETYLPDGTYDYLLFNKKTGVWEKQNGMLKDFDMSR
jgi:hypothetical protein